MIISDDQVRRAVECLRAGGTGDCEGAGRSSGSDALPGDLIERVSAAIQAQPDTRDERVSHAREVLGHGGHDSREIVEKMIGRMISDSLR